MTAQEQQMIDDLVDRIRNTQLSDKDPDAEERLKQGLASYPDAIYVLAQTVLVQKYGLEQAQQKIQSMQAELDQFHQQPHPHGSFLGNLLGINDQPQAQSQYAPYPPQAYPPQAYAQPAYAAAQPGGFLRSAMQTAAGVAMGEMVFQGMEGLFHGFGGGYGGGYGEGRPAEVVNNYYNDTPTEHHNLDSNDSNFYNPSNDASRDDFASNTDYDSGTDSSSSDDTGFSGDGGGGDDSGGNDGGS